MYARTDRHRFSKLSLVVLSPLPVIFDGKPTLPGKPAFFSDTELIMKLLENPVFESAYQGMQCDPGRLSGIYQNETTRNLFFYQLTQELRQELEQRLKRFYSLIRTALPHGISGKIDQFQSTDATRTEIPANYRTNINFPKALDDSNPHWVRSGRPHQFHVYLAVNRLKTSHHHLTNQTILCIGGRAALYSDYHRLIEAAGGHFMVFRGGAQDNTDCLLALLARVNIVICPVDCISHEDFFTTRQYCQRTRKSCVMLERSDLATFGKAVEALARNGWHDLRHESLNHSTTRSPVL